MSKRTMSHTEPRRCGNPAGSELDRRRKDGGFIADVSVMMQSRGGRRRVARELRRGKLTREVVARALGVDVAELPR